MKIVSIQAIAFKFLDEGFIERLRFRLKNEVKVLYRYVLINTDILKNHAAGKITKSELMKKYAITMAEQLEELTLRKLDD